MASVLQLTAHQVYPASAQLKTLAGAYCRARAHFTCPAHPLFHLTHTHSLALPPAAAGASAAGVDAYDEG